jgi:hypothetical protein
MSGEDVQTTLEMSGEDVQTTLVSSVSFHHFPFTVSVPTLKMSLYFEISSLRTDSGRVKTSQLRKTTLEMSGKDVKTHSKRVENM